MTQQLSRAFVLTLAFLLLTACSNLAEKRTELAAAGFRTIPVTTPAQLAKFNSIKTNKVIPMTSKQGTVYLFADKAKHTIMVGSPAQYQQYRALKLKQQKIDEKLLDAQVNLDNADYNAWGSGSDWAWGVASDPL